MLHYGLDVYGAADSYAFSSMVRPAFGSSLNIGNGRYFVKAHADVMLPNADPNGGLAAVLSLRMGRSFTVEKHTRVSVFAEYQHLAYGGLYNNGVGGGASVMLTYHRFFFTGTVAALYGFSGDIGYHLSTPGNDYIFVGKLGYRLPARLGGVSPYLFIEQQRYIGNGNALTSQSTGAGIQYRW